MNRKHNSFSRVDQINQPSLLSSPLLQGSETTPWFRSPNSGGGGGVVQERASFGVREASNVKKVVHLYNLQEVQWTFAAEIRKFVLSIHFQSSHVKK